MEYPHIASVILDTAIDKTLDYRIPEHLLASLRPGMRVLVPVRGAARKGTVLCLKETAEVSSPLPICELLSEHSLISPDLFTLAHWMAHYYCTPLRKVLKMILPPSIRQDKKEKKQLFVTPLLSINELRTFCENNRTKKPLHAQVLDVLLKFPKGLLLSQLLEKANCSQSVIKTLAKQQLVECHPIAIDRSFALEHDHFHTKAKKLSEEQQEALEKIQASLHEKRFETHLLYGITGSGKTEVYLQAIEEALKLGKETIFLVPEIALTSQTLERLRSRFSEKIVLLHHRLSEGERRDSWHRMASGGAPIVIGARSALFSPLPNLGLIIVDEEHESAYKQQDESPTYHARDVAIMRAKLTASTIILGSATPSLESFHNASLSKYTLSYLKKRAEASSLPRVTIIDMQHEYNKAKQITLFSDALLTAIEKRWKIGEQSLLFLNRRGFHTMQVCKCCAHVIQCPHCDVSLTFHLGDNLLACHLCDHRLSPPPRSCPSCHNDEGLKYRGAGTQLVERTLQNLFPNIRTLRLDADTTRHKGSHEQLFKQFRSGKADLLIGTQMIAKGLHFPSVTLVGILNADASLHLPDFRAAEQVFQLITQVSGRSGRGQLPGEVLIQTSLPQHPTILQAADQNFEAFFQSEIESRQAFDYPPFTHLAKLTFTGPSAKETEQSAHLFRQKVIASLPPIFQILPLIPAGHAKIKDNYRFQFLIKGAKIMTLSPLLHSLVQNSPLPKAVRLLIDIDPTSTF